jgi:hypothetical protein
MMAPAEIDGPIQVTPAALHANVGFVHAPGFNGRLEMPPHALLQFRTVPLHPTRSGCHFGVPSGYQLTLRPLAAHPGRVRNQTNQCLTALWGLIAFWCDRKRGVGAVELQT